MSQDTAQTRRQLAANPGPADRTFRGVARGGGMLVLVLMVLVGTFLAYRAAQALHRAGLSFLTVQDWNPDGGRFGIAAVIVGTVLIALVAVVVACSIMREGFSQAPIGEREGAYALGATRWGMIRSVVLPFGRGAVIGGTMLGLGRALGETIAVVMIISPRFLIQPRILENGTSSVSSLIALRYGEASPFGISALMAAGLALFALTLVVNFAAASVVARSRSGAVSEV